MATKDDQIVAEVLSGKTSEYRHLVERHQASVFRFAYNLIGDRHDAEDITQDVFLAAFDRLRSFDSRKATLPTWLFTIARNRCVNHLKRRRPVANSDQVATANSFSATSNVERQEFWRQLDDALSSLPLEQRSAFVLAEIEDLAYEQIAQIEGASLGTIKSRIHRAKKRLRSILEPTMGDH